MQNECRLPAAYDQVNRLRTAAVAGATETSTYDGDGVRFSRQVGAGPVIRAVTDPTAGLPVTIDDGTRKYVWGLGLAYAVNGTAIEVQHADRLGSIRAATDATGAVIASYRTDEFGIPTTSTGAAGSPFRYTGEPLDASGLTYLRARHYDPSIGRFLSRDPFAGFASSPLSLNRYSYVRNNPATWRDPSGLDISVVLGGKKADIKAFDAAMEECGRALGREITKDMRRMIHDLIPEIFVGRVPTYRELVDLCLSEFNTPEDRYVTESEAADMGPWLMFWPIMPAPRLVPLPFPVFGPGPVPVFL